jgi:ABC-type nitrate/sulfonate/bicarbonate transport system permease component
VTAAAVTARMPRTSALSPRATRVLLRVAAGIAILLLWEALVTWLAASFVARPSGIIKVAPSVLRDGGFWTDTQQTIVAVAEGMVIGVVLGTLVGLAMGRLRDVESSLKFYVNAFFALPTIAVLPLMTLWFGYTGRARLSIVILGAFLPVALNVYDGARRVPTTFIEVSKTYHARWWNVWFGIALPSALPYLIAGLRLAAGRALVAAVVAEYLLGNIGGLGYYIVFNSRSFHQNAAAVGALMLALIGVLINTSLDASMRRFLPWYRRA